ncbi:transaldolase/glucose-6-phosphate isomerase [Salinibacter ruber]|uniref:bifunctional transaldolase/phosoglucose isomerase n=1 Tax=Salinibacter ruber TaxID=146919 RepID=UPI0020747EB8|nr:bifunctional transaldolase/phosoglucose isomerase [Salinibacter ruber]MCS3830635.1 transaldolase/glucose-6-phosphate isomerase [Salinibacter ruber]MCS4057080.1 transaldolase/glucose-6-phosphate isomerase [Salinibacter ruber]MCS4060304.1 transaldolase/glucose-6-phosphate isomerase [Salinibacter ruber]MCS4100127.1 transaldolase/glucose-6-phosphate isomerase [Salinibacter ruber]MCS4161713.1 transaldolase/glucose-6-phosphate isomerase [Salinibacter ruber]
MPTAQTADTPTRAVRAEGQSLWLDYIRRSLMESGQLERLVEEDALRGLTSNPAIFEKAIGGSSEYDDAITAFLTEDPSMDAATIYERLAVEDIRRAADTLRPVYEETGVDGVVSLEVSPHLAHDTEGTIEEARRLWDAVGRPNLMIKVPATEEGIPAIEQLLSEGINVNVTLMFSLGHYEKVAQAYLRGLRRADDPSGIVSVASFFVSRVAREVDTRLDERGLTDAVDFDGSDVAIANARMAYRRFEEIFHGDDFADLREQGAFVQRPLWASTSTKDPTRSDVLYVESLIGEQTVNTIPPDTLDAFRDHGTVAGQTVTDDLDRAEAVLRRLDEVGIDLDDVTETLQARGVEKFATPFDDLMDVLEEKREEITAHLPDPISLHLHEHETAVAERLDAWREDDFACRMWRRDPTLWADEDTPELTNRLGWLDLPESMQEQAAEITAFADSVTGDFDDVVVLGMGGSSLAPDVFGRVFDPADGCPDVTVLDSTHPDAVTALADDLALERTLFVVASKSGTTTETLSFFRYFWDRVSGLTDTPGDHFVANTDPGSNLEEIAEDRDFRAVFRAPSDVGGRYSALTPFGLVPAALMGVDIEQLLDRAWAAEAGSDFCVEAPNNSGLELGAALGELATAGRDKVTFVTSPTLEAFPAWQEQLIAESTGKDDTGIVPVADEPLAGPGAYGEDRVFVYFYLHGEQDRNTIETLSALDEAGHPVISVRLDDRYDLAREMYRWEMGVAAAGAVLGIHPFNQPNVEAAKRLAREAMQAENGTGSDTHTVAADDHDVLEQELADWLDAADETGYLGVQAYLPPSDETTATLTDLVTALRDTTGCATTLDYGPRFLHSTGQLHKGGPPNGLFLQLVDTPDATGPVPETDYTFEELIAAQATGDHQALREADRTVLRVRVDDDSLGDLAEAIRAR